MIALLLPGKYPGPWCSLIRRLRENQNQEMQVRLCPGGTGLGGGGRDGSTGYDGELVRARSE